MRHSTTELLARLHDYTWNFTYEKKYGTSLAEQEGIPPMPTYQVKLVVLPNKRSVNPEERAIIQTLHSLGFTDVVSLRYGKMYTITITAPNKEKAREQILAAEKKLGLSRPAINDECYILSLRLLE